MSKHFCYFFSALQDSTIAYTRPPLQYRRSPHSWCCVNRYRQAGSTKLNKSGNAQEGEHRFVVHGIWQTTLLERSARSATYPGCCLATCFVTFVVFFDSIALNKRLHTPTELGCLKRRIFLAAGDACRWLETPAHPFSDCTHP